MIPGEIYKSGGDGPAGRLPYWLVLENPAEDGLVDSIPFVMNAIADDNNCIPVNPSNLPQGFAVVGRTYPVRNGDLDELVGRLGLQDMERVTRALVRRAVGRHYPYGHPDSVFQPGESPVPVSGRVYGEADVTSLVDASLDFWLTTGRFNAAFESRFSRILGIDYVLSTNSGSSANLLAVSALTSPKLGDRALKKGDEVITVAAGFPTTVNPIIQNGLVPVFCDVNPATCNIIPEELEKALSPKTKAVVLAHTLGFPFDLEAVGAFCREHGLWLIEDCCDALGATFQDENGAMRQVGTFGDIATFSFYPAHHVTMGEGGAVATRSGKLKKLIESFRDWGRDCWCPPGRDNTCGCRYEWKLGDLPEGYDHKYVYSHIGYNLKITDMQAAVGLSQLDRLEGFIRKRRENYSILDSAFQEMKGVFLLPESSPRSQPSYFGFPLTIRPESGVQREPLLKHLGKAKIGSRLLFGGNLVKQPYMRGVSFRQIGDLSGTDTIMRHTFWIGVYPKLTPAMLRYVIATVREYVHSAVMG